MQTDTGPPPGGSASPDRVDDLLRGRMKILGLDIATIERDFSDVFATIKKNCPLCGDRGPCAIDLKRDPDSIIWEAYCPNSDALSVLVALTEAR